MQSEDVKRGREAIKHEAKHDEQNTEHGRIASGEGA